MVDELKKEEELFKVLLAHWINHTGDHIDGYAEWRDQLKDTEKNKISCEIDSAIQKMKMVQRKLMEAKIHF